MTQTLQQVVWFEVTIKDPEDDYYDYEYGLGKLCLQICSSFNLTARLVSLRFKTFTTKKIIHSNLIDLCYECKVWHDHL